MYSASILFFACNVLDLYATIKYAATNSRISIKIIITSVGSFLALIYSIRINNIPLILNFTPIFFLNTTNVIIRFYYTYCIQERSGRTLFGRISNNIPENDVGVCRNITNNAKEPLTLHPVSYFPNTLLNEPMQRRSEGTLPHFEPNHTDNHTPVPWFKNMFQIMGFLFRTDTATISLSNEIPPPGVSSQNAVRIAPVWSYITLSHFIPSHIFSVHEADVVPRPRPSHVVPHDSVESSIHNAVHGYQGYAIGQSIPSSHGGDILPPGHGGDILPPGHGGDILSPGHGGDILPPGHGGDILPPGRNPNQNN